MKKLSVLYAFSKPGVAKTIDKALEVSENRCELDIFLDSGAFSAFTLGLEMDIDNYIQLIYKYKKKITCYANLDVIDDFDKTLEHQQIMEDSGLHPIPVFQYRSDYGYAKELAQKYNHVAISGPGELPTTAYAGFTSMAVSVMREVNPQIKIHGFGITRSELLETINYDSVDSSTWNCGRYGAMWLYNPKRVWLRMFQRLCTPTLAMEYKLFTETLAFYGLTPKDFIRRHDVEKYSWACLKGFYHFSKYLTQKWGHEFKIYFAGLEPGMLRKGGLIEYITSELDSDGSWVKDSFAKYSKKYDPNRVGPKIKNRKWGRVLER